jgi:hypothetical protein
VQWAPEYVIRQFFIRRWEAVVTWSAVNILLNNTPYYQQQRRK